MGKMFFVRIFIILLMLSPLLSFAQTKKVTGTVTDENGSPIAGATVTVKGTQVSTKTTTIGLFELDAPVTGKTLVVTHVGMRPREIAIGRDATFNISLESSVNVLDNVVVIGYGRANRANLTTAQTTVSAKDINKTVNTTLEQALQGRAAGVYVTQSSGQPGGALSVNIRGISSITGNTEPLYVIDGNQMHSGSANSSNPLAGLNPADIEDIQILQGPSATAIYGSQATNGVIIITTKRGRTGDTKLNYQVQYNIQSAPEPVDVMNLQQYAQMRNEFHALAGGTTPQEFLDPSILGKGTDWQKELFNSAAMHKHSLSLSGGSQSTTYYVSGEYLKQEGVAIGSGFDRYGVRVNLENKPRTWATVGLNLSFSQTNEQLSTSSESVIADALTITPQVPVKNLNGEWGGGDIINGANQFAPVNPIAIASFTTNKNRRRQFWGGINLALNLAKGLTFRTTFNTDIRYGNSLFYRPTYRIGWAVNSTATLNNFVGMNSYWNWNKLLEYTKQIGKHNFTVMASHEAQESNWQNLSGGRSGFLTNDVFDLNAGSPPGTNGGGSGEWAMESLLGRLSYNYDNRYILMSAYRRDGAGVFGPGNKWGDFPSLSVAWRISKEKFFAIPWISELKLRYEIGLTGNQGGGSGIYSPLNSGLSDLGAGFLPGRYGNPNTQWEETKTDNFGVNVGFLKNKIAVEFDYYLRRTNEI